MTEKKEHCGSETEYLSGIHIFDNNGVNALSSIIITILAILIY